MGNEILQKKRNNFIVYKEEKRLVLSIDDKNNFVQKEEKVKIPLNGEKEIVYLDELLKEFTDKDIIDIDFLKQKGILKENTDFYKVIYRGGEVNKGLNIIASAESQAVKKLLEEAGGSYTVEVK